MKPSVAAILGALVATVCAKPAFTYTNFELTEGAPITLVSGTDSSKSLQPVKTLTGTWDAQLIQLRYIFLVTNPKGLIGSRASR
jgi:hypothetical protein